MRNGVRSEKLLAKAGLCCCKLCSLNLSRVLGGCLFIHSFYCTSGKGKWRIFKTPRQQLISSGPTDSRHAVLCPLSGGACDELFSARHRPDNNHKRKR